MPPEIAAFVAFVQLIILVTVGIVWANIAWKFWKKQERKPLALHWGGALVLLSFWRASAWLDGQTTGLLIGDWLNVVVAWTLVGAICVINFILWLRGEDGPATN